MTGMKLTEFYPEKQGRPDSKVTLDMERRQPIIPPGLISGVMLQSSYMTGEVTNNYTASNVAVILADCEGGDITVTLPAASSSAGRYYYVKKVDSTDHKLIVEPNSDDELIDGEKILEITLQYGYACVLCSGVESGDSYWHIIGGVSVKLEDILSDKLEQQISLLARLLAEATQGKLHLASLSDADIDEADIEIN